MFLEQYILHALAAVRRFFTLRFTALHGVSVVTAENSGSMPFNKLNAETHWHGAGGSDYDAAAAMLGEEVMQGALTAARTRFCRHALRVLGKGTLFPFCIYLPILPPLV